MSATPRDFQRARRPEHKQERRRAILDAARALAEERPVRDVSLGDLARRVGLAKSAVLRYFESREDVYLQLTAAEWEAWVAEAVPRIRAAAPSAERATAELAATLTARPLLCDLVSQTASVLEHNVSAEAARRFKAATLVHVATVGEALAAAVPGLAPDAAREVSALAMVLVAGMWPMATPAPEVAAMLAADPAMAHAQVDIEPRVARALAALAKGLQTTATLADAEAP